MRSVKFDLVCQKGNLESLCNALEENGLDQLVLGTIPKTFVKDYLYKRRPNLSLYEILIDGEEPIELAFVSETLSDVKVMSDFFKEMEKKNKEVEDLQIVPIPLDFIKDYIAGKRQSLISFELREIADEDEAEELGLEKEE